MSGRAEATRPCPLCGSRLLTPVFYPPLVRCDRCGLVFRNLQGVQEQIKEGFEGVYSRLALERGVQDRRGPLYREFLARYRPGTGMNRLLDVGCGTGQFLMLAREQGWDVMGMEITEAGAEAARAAGLPVRVESLTTTSLPESFFHVVTLWNVLDLVPDPVAHVSAAKRVLAPAGVLVVRMGNLAFHAALYRLSRLLRGWLHLGALLAQQCFFSQICFNARTLRQTLERGGFRNIKIANSPLSYGDPYRTLPHRGDRVPQAMKRMVYGLTSFIAACSAGKVLLGPSLWAKAVKEDSPAELRRERRGGQARP